MEIRSFLSRIFFATSVSTLLCAQTSLTGAGATFSAPLYQKWFNDYQSIGNVQINYQPNGSGGGIEAITEAPSILERATCL